MKKNPITSTSANGVAPPLPHPCEVKVHLSRCFVSLCFREPPLRGKDGGRQGRREGVNAVRLNRFAPTAIAFSFGPFQFCSAYYGQPACTASKLVAPFSCVPDVDEATREHREAAEDLQRHLYATSQQLGGGGRRRVLPTGLCRAVSTSL